MTDMADLIQGFLIFSATISILTGVWFFRERISDMADYIEDKYTPSIVPGIFSPEADITVVEDGIQFKNLIKPAADNAAVKVDMISIHMATVDKIQDKQFSNPDVQHRILLLDPLADSTDRESGLTGIEAARNSRFQDNELITRDKFKKQFDWFYRNVQERNWENVEIRLYQTTPWFRGVFVDSQYAGFLLTPTIQDGRTTTKFWTEDRNVVEILENNFEDIWTDDRTVEFEEWYDEHGEHL